MLAQRADQQLVLALLAEVIQLQRGELGGQIAQGDAQREAPQQIGIDLLIVFADLSAQLTWLAQPFGGQLGRQLVDEGAFAAARPTQQGHQSVLGNDFERANAISISVRVFIFARAALAEHSYLLTFATGIGHLSARVIVFAHQININIVEGDVFAHIFLAAHRGERQVIALLAQPAQVTNTSGFGGVSGRWIDDGCVGGLVVASNHLAACCADLARNGAAADRAGVFNFASFATRFFLSSLLCRGLCRKLRLECLDLALHLFAGRLGSVAHIFTSLKCSEGLPV